MPFPPPGDLPDSGIKPTASVASALAGRFFFFLFLPLSHLESPSLDLLSAINVAGTVLCDSQKQICSVPTVTLEVDAAAAAKSLQSRLTLCDPVDGSPPGSPVPGTLQATTLEWVAISFSNA